jgi:hypothetical protein
MSADPSVTGPQCGPYDRNGNSLPQSAIRNPQSDHSGSGLPLVSGPNQMMTSPTR